MKDIELPLICREVQSSPLVETFSVDISCLISMLGFVNQTLYFFEGAIFSRHEEILIIALLFLPPLLDGPCILLADSYNRSIWGIQDI